MAGSKSSTIVRTAIDSILSEFCKYDQDREKWYKEKMQLQQEINMYKKQLADKDKEYNTLQKRYKVLEIIINQKTNNSNNTSDKFKFKPNIKLKLKSKTKKPQTFYATLPASLSPQKFMNIIDDFTGKWTNNKDEKKENKKDEVKDNKKDELNNNNNNNNKHEEEIKTSTNEREKDAFKLQLNGNSILLRHHLDIIRSICLNDDETVLISTSDDGTIKLWDLTKINENQKQPIPITFRGHSSSVNCSTIMPNTNILVTAGFDTNIYGWKLPINGSILMEMDSLSILKQFEMKQHTNIVWDIAANYSSPIISSVSSDNSIKLFNIETQQLLLSYNINSPTSIVWNNNIKEKLCIGTMYGNIIVFDIEKKKIISNVYDNNNNSNGYCINKIYNDDNLKNSSLIYSCCNDSKVRVFDINSNKCIISQKVHTDSVTSMVIHSATSSIFTASHDSRLRVWDFKTNKFSCIQDLEPQDTHTQKWDEGILCMAFNNSYKWLFSGGADGIKLYKTNL